MSQHFFGVNVGDSDVNGVVTIGTGDTGDDIQLVTVDGNVPDRKTVKRYLERIIRFIVAEDTSSIFPK